MKQGPTTTGWVNFPGIGTGGNRIPVRKIAPRTISGTSKLTADRLDAKLHGDKIDRANALKGGSTKKTSPLQRVKCCKCVDAASCTHGERPTLIPIVTPKAFIRNAGVYADRENYDPKTNLRYPSGYSSLCPRCEHQQCTCGRDKEVARRLGKDRDMKPIMNAEGTHVVEWVPA